MGIATKYLEAAKVDQVATELELQGYQVTKEPPSVDDRYDLLATKDGKTIAIEVKARSELRASMDEIRRLREQAKQQGYAEFRLIVANAPREKSISVSGLENTLGELIREDVPSELYDVASAPFIEGVSAIEIDSVQITTHGIEVEGTGLVDVDLESGGGEVRDGMTWSTDFPFSFSILLNSDLEIAQVHNLKVDTSSFYE